MILERGNMWDVFGKTDLFLITTNPIIRKDGAVVMGRGIAKEFATRYPKGPYDFGDELKHGIFRGNTGRIGEYDKQVVGYFMVKDHWREPAKLEIIEESLRQLLAGEPARHHYSRIDMNFPGIGNGKLNRLDVLLLLQDYLASDVYHVWEYGID